MFFGPVEGRVVLKAGRRCLVDKCLGLPGQVWT